MIRFQKRQICQCLNLMILSLT